MKFIKTLINMIAHLDFKLVYSQRTSKTILNVFSAFFILFLIISFKFYYDFSNEFDKMHDYMNDIPYFTIKNGELNFEGQQPYYLIPGDKSYIIDTTGNTEPSVLDNVQNGILITKNKLYIKSGIYDNRSFDLQMINEASSLLTVTRNDITSWVMSLSFPVYLITDLFISFYHLIAKTTAILFLSLVLLIIVSITKKRISYNSIFNISAYVFMFPIFLYWLKSIIGIYIPFFFILYWVLALVYGIIAIKKYTPTY